MKRPSVTRRRFLKILGVSLGAAACSGVYATGIEPYWLEIVRRPLPIRQLPASLVGCTLAHLSDAHLSAWADTRYLIAAFRRVAALHPDVVVFTGDFISYHPAIFEQFPQVYQFFPTGRLATLAVLGNHDYGEAWSHPEVAARVVAALQPFGVAVLRNEVREVAGLQVVGLDDFWGTQFQPELAFAALDQTRAAVVLSHNPDTVDLPIWKDYEGWILAGHTHGGQCKPPFLPPPLLPVQNRRYTAGEFALAGNRRLYINRGVGYLVPVRFNVRPEVTLFELSAA